MNVFKERATCSVNHCLYIKKKFKKSFPPCCNEIIAYCDVKTEISTEHHICYMMYIIYHYTPIDYIIYVIFIYNIEYY